VLSYYAYAQYSEYVTTKSLYTTHRLLAAFEMLCDRAKNHFYDDFVYFSFEYRPRWKSKVYENESERALLAVIFKSIIADEMYYLGREVKKLLPKLNLTERDKENVKEYLTGTFIFDGPLEPFAKHFIRPDLTSYDIQIINAITDDPKIKALCPAMQTLLDLLTKKVAQKSAK
jgi:hypothetical protein